MAVFKSQFVSKVRVAIWILIHLFHLARVDYLVSLPGTALSQSISPPCQSASLRSYSNLISLVPRLSLLWFSPYCSTDKLSLLPLTLTCPVHSFLCYATREASAYKTELTGKQSFPIRRQLTLPLLSPVGSVLANVRLQFILLDSQRLLCLPLCLFLGQDYDPEQSSAVLAGQTVAAHTALIFTTRTESERRTAMKWKLTKDSTHHQDPILKSSNQSSNRAQGTIYCCADTNGEEKELH